MVFSRNNKLARTHEGFMKKQMTWEAREMTYVRSYQVVGERLLPHDGEVGWYVSTWADSVPIIGYWAAEGKFYHASINWLTGRTVDLEITREIVLDPERERVTMEAIERWKKNPENRIDGHATMDQSAFHLAAA